MIRRIVAGARSWTSSLPLLSVALLALMLGCAASAPPQPTDTIAPTVQPSATNTPAFGSPTPGSGSTPLATATGGAKTDLASIPVGTDVGDRIPEFAISLADGTTVTLDDLVQEQRPTFLFFFTTW
jgi:hypothetical protein